MGMKFYNYCLATLLFTSLILTGCNSDNRYHADKGTNFLGIMKTKPGSFEPESPDSITIKTSDIVNAQDPSGDEVELFWGLVSFKDQ